MKLELFLRVVYIFGLINYFIGEKLSFFFYYFRELCFFVGNKYNFFNYLRIFLFVCGFFSCNVINCIK